MTMTGKSAGHDEQLQLQCTMNVWDERSAEGRCTDAIGIRRLINSGRLMDRSCYCHNNADA